MSLSGTLFGPSHYWWKAFKEAGVSRTWFVKPDEYSTGGVGFCIPGLHVCLTWGQTR